ncbi:MAG: hypothetical protein R3F21_01895 [Myxococcota bacterium]
MTNAIAFLDPEPIELGSLVAALAEETEDEFELDLRVRRFIEAGRARVSRGRADRRLEVPSARTPARRFAAVAPAPRN